MAPSRNGAKTGATAAPFSLDPQMIQRIFEHAKPLGHSETPADLNLGFGFVYYGLVRALRPEHVVVIGSGYGFSVVCLALGLKDNRAGRLTFVDPSYSLLRNGPTNTIGGVNFWRDPSQVRRHFARFGVEDIVTHHKQTSEDFFARYAESGLPTIDMAFIDGNHSYAHVQHDVVASLRHSRKNAYFLLHDTNIYIREFLRHAGVKRWLRSKANRHKAAFEYVDFPFASGVAVVRVLEPKVWKQLSTS
jgi:predicted O-methyltransferase YrrM